MCVISATYRIFDLHSQLMAL